MCAPVGIVFAHLHCVLACSSLFPKRHSAFTRVAVLIASQIAMACNLSAPRSSSVKAYDEDVSAKVSAAYEQMEEGYEGNLQKFRAAKLEGKEVTDLRIVTYNLGLLSLSLSVDPLITDPITITDGWDPPVHAERAQNWERHMQEFLERENPDIVFIQECWRARDHRKLVHLSEALVYLVADQNVERASWFRSTTGLKVLVHRDLLAGHELDLPSVAELSSKSTIMGYDYVGQITRVVLEVPITLRNGITLTLLNTHLNAGFNRGGPGVRSEQLSQVAQVARNAQTDFVIIGADFNVSPEFGELREDDIGSREQWQDNRLDYARFVAETRGKTLSDTYFIKNPNDNGFTQDREKNPLAALGRTTRKEPSLRIDFVWVGTNASGTSSYQIDDSRIVLDEVIRGENGEALVAKERRWSTGGVSEWKWVETEVPLSDHYGVSTKMRLIRSP